MANNAPSTHAGRAEAEAGVGAVSVSDGPASGQDGHASGSEQETEDDKRIPVLKTLWDLSVNASLCALLLGLDCIAVLEVIRERKKEKERERDSQTNR